ncbi:MAG: insulinase family protein [Proteobacteria bacterium]|nr:insulinase family protein [Pseudomonadota bacterium]
MRGLVHYLFILLCLNFSIAHADVLPIQSFKTPSGLEVWLIEDRSTPLVSLVLKFERTVNESPYQPSTLLFQRALADGAGVLTPLEMNRFVKETPSTASLDVGFSKTSLTLQTTKEGLAATLQLWARLIENPEFQKANLSHSKSQTITRLSYYEEDLGLIGFLKLLQEIFPDITINIDFENAAKSIEAMTADDLKKETTKQFLSAKPKIVVVGNVNKNELTDLLDSSMGKISILPSSNPPPSPKPDWHNKDLMIHKDVPQSVVAFAQPGLNPHHKDYPKYVLLQYVLYTRMFDELREKRGMIYSIQYSDLHYKGVDLLFGNFSCECSNSSKTAKFIRSEWERLKDFGITQQELSAAILAYKRDKVLTLTSTLQVANEYAFPMAFNLGPDSAKTLLEQTEKVTLEDINQFVSEILKPESLSFVLLGSSVQTSKPRGNK